ncbi:MAG: hypothetical protein HYX75_20955 [Acidobacteria bacterium]|nr:hypothetical protein [Acidobacteriota bacterium]
MSLLTTKDMEVNQFIDALGAANIPSEALQIAFGPGLQRFCRYAYDREFLAATEQGRIFSPRGELRWRRVGRSMRVVYLGEGPPHIEGEDRSAALVELAPRIDRFVLWGVRTNLENEWIEQQVPHRFAYPIDSAVHNRGRVALAVQNWVGRNEIVQFSRYYRIEEMPGRESNAGGE